MWKGVWAVCVCVCIDVTTTVLKGCVLRQAMVCSIDTYSNEQHMSH